MSCVIGVGVDVGSESVKGALTDPDGRALDTAGYGPRDVPSGRRLGRTGPDGVASQRGSRRSVTHVHPGTPGGRGEPPRPDFPV
jgi:hypothetical protein